MTNAIHQLMLTGLGVTICVFFSFYIFFSFLASKENCIVGGSEKVYMYLQFTNCGITCI